MAFQKLPTHTGRRPAFFWMARVALLALVLQALMPLTHALAASAGNEPGRASQSLLMVCTALGMKALGVPAPGNEQPDPTGMLAWECPLCLTQLSARIGVPPAPANGWRSPLVNLVSALPRHNHDIPLTWSYRPSLARAPPA